MDALRELLNTDITGWILTTMLILVALKFCYETIIKILDYLGITTKRTLKEKETMGRISKLEQHDKAQYDKLNNISSSIEDIKQLIIQNQQNFTDLEKENDMRRIKDLKAEILAFARSLKRFESDGITNFLTEEDFDQTFSAFGEYEELLKHYGLTNGKTIRAMQFINKISNELGYGTVQL